MSIQFSDISILFYLAAAVIAVTAVLFLMRRRTEDETAVQPEENETSEFRITEKIIVTHTDEAKPNEQKGGS